MDASINPWIAFAVFFATFVAFDALTRAVKRRLRDRHPLIYSRMIPKPAAPDSDGEREEIFAGFEFSEYLRSRKWEQLADERLARLIRWRRICFWLGCGMLVVVIGTMRKGA